MRKVLQILLISIICQTGLLAQDDQQIVQFSGLVVAGDSLFGVKGVHVVNVNEQKGVTTDKYGFFSFPAKENDTILFTFIGFEKASIVIPEDNDDQKFTQIIELIADTTQLYSVDVIPYPTLQVFKEAFVRLELEDEDLHQNMAKNLDEKELRRMFQAMDMDASMNYRNYTQQQITQYYERPNFFGTTELLNPFAWIRFIKAVKNGEFKREDD